MKNEKQMTDEVIELKYRYQNKRVQAGQCKCHICKVVKLAFLKKNVADVAEI